VKALSIWSAEEVAKSFAHALMTISLKNGTAGIFDQAEANWLYEMIQ